MYIILNASRIFIQCIGICISIIIISCFCCTISTVILLRSGRCGTPRLLKVFLSPGQRGAGTCRVLPQVPELAWGQDPVERHSSTQEAGVGLRLGLYFGMVLHYSDCILYSFDRFGPHFPHFTTCIVSFIK